MSAAALEVPKISVTDPCAPGEPSWFEAQIDAIATPLLRDPRDVVFPRLAGRITARVLPFAAVLYFLPVWAVALLAVPYLANLFAGFGGPMVLMLHAVTHRPVFKTAKFLDKFITHFLPPFFGMTPGAYYPHHVQMHHVESCSEDDLSGTAQYERDNIAHFVHYWARFTFFAYYHMTSWLVRRGKWRSLKNMIAIETVAYTVIAALFVLNPAATTVVFVLPYLMLRFFLMAGNWSEHAFVDVADPANDWTNSTCLLNAPYNHRCFNAGYHLVHHRSPGAHWTEATSLFNKLLPKMIEEDSVIFDGVTNNQQIWWKLMTHDYGFLADHLVDIGGRRPTREAKIAFLKSRVRGTVGKRKGLLERREARPTGLPA